MAKTDFVYYDTADVATTGNTDINFFSRSEGANGRAITNLETANEIPVGQTFTLNEIHIFTTGDIVGDDVYEIMEEAILEILISGNRKFIAPALLCATSSHYYLAVQDKTDATQLAFGTPTGGPYKFDKPMVIKGGENFRVIFRTGTTAPADGAEVVIALRGEIEGR